MKKKISMLLSTALIFTSTAPAFGLSNNDLILAEATPAFKAINGIEISSETLAQSTDNFFTSDVNNWAFLCQNTHVLNKVTINVDYTL